MKSILSVFRNFYWGLGQPLINVLEWTSSKLVHTHTSTHTHRRMKLLFSIESRNLLFTNILLYNTREILPWRVLCSKICKNVLLQIFLIPLCSLMCNRLPFSTFFTLNTISWMGESRVPFNLVWSKMSPNVFDKIILNKMTFWQ